MGFVGSTLDLSRFGLSQSMTSSAVASKGTGSDASLSIGQRVTPETHVP